MKTCSLNLLSTRLRICLVMCGAGILLSYPNFAPASTDTPFFEKAKKLHQLDSQGRARITSIAMENKTLISDPKGEPIQKVVPAVQAELAKEWEKRFKLKFTDVEQKYLNDLYSRELMKKFLDFNVQFFNGPETEQFIITKIKEKSKKPGMTK